MTTPTTREAREYELTLHVFSISAGLVGVCLTGLGLIKVITQRSQVGTLADDLLAGDAALFMCCCFFAFWSFKTRHTRLRQMLRNILDGLFMLALALMVGVCGVIVYVLV